MNATADMDIHAAMICLNSLNQRHHPENIIHKRDFRHHKHYEHDNRQNFVAIPENSKMNCFEPRARIGSDQH